MSPSPTPFESLLKDQDIVDEIGNRAAEGRLKNATSEAPRRRILERVQPSFRTEALGRDFDTEAIVLAFGRPSLLVRNGTFELPESTTWREILSLSRPRIEEAIARVGRIELINSEMDWVGTGWLIDEAIIATNRHVAVEFAEARGGRLAFRKSPFNSETMSALVDFRQEYDVVESIEIPVAEVLFIAAEQEPDIAFLRIEADVPLPAPLMLDGAEIAERQNIGVIGYPAYDSRNGEDAMRRYFDGKYNVKRFAPGRISDRVASEHYFKHDCTTLGGNSGSCVIDLETGRVVGLHFAGSFKIANYAVKTSSSRAGPIRYSHQQACQAGTKTGSPRRPDPP